MCSGSSKSATKASVNAPSNQQHHPSYENAACAGSDISTACHPPSLYEEYLTSTLTSMVGSDQEAPPKPDGRIQSNMISILLASTPSMPHRWSMTDPSGTLEPEQVSRVLQVNQEPVLLLLLLLYTPNNHL